MKRSILATALIFSAVLFVASCSDGGSDKSGTESGTPNEAAEGDEVHGSLIQPGDVQLATPLNQEWIAAGKGIYDMKCMSCHKLTDERLVGPGWKGLTTKREPHWILNMITNVDVMLEKDAEAQKLLEQCLVRMPNQNISKDEARQVLEFMRNNDGVQ
ncbi:MAG: c-type cytochrome [Flavisolibacter sp.]